jgi:hypothetical protein
MANTKFSTSSINQGLVKSRSMLVGNTFYDPTEFESIATVVVGAGGASDVTFSSIPGTYANLQIRAIVKNTANNNEGIRFRFNGDTAGNYSFHRLFGDGSSPTVYGEANTTYAGEASSSNSPQTNIFSTFIYDILDYANTNKFKTTRGLSGKDFNGSGNIMLFSGNWRNTNAITSITIYPTQDNFAQYSKFALYGIKD